MKIKTITILSLAVASLLITGCSQKTSTTVGSSSVKHLNKAQFDQEFIEGRTTLSEVTAKLGRPSTKTSSNGLNFYGWSYGTVEGETNTMAYVPYANLLLGKAGGKSTQKIVLMGFDRNNLLAQKQWHGTKTVDIGFKGLFAR